MATIPLIAGPSASVTLQNGDPAAQALGLVAWTGHPSGYQQAATVTTQAVFQMGLWVPSGSTFSNVILWVGVAGSGTAPTGLFVGVSDTVNMVAQSANLASDAGWTSTGFHKFALGTTVNVVDGGWFYVDVLQNGVFGTTPLQLQRTLLPGSLINAAASNFYYATGGSGKTTLPANAAAQTPGAGGTPYWAALTA